MMSSQGVPQKNWNDKCAVFGVWNHPAAIEMSYLGLYAQQHRGQEGAGIVSLHENRHFIHRGAGLVGEVFSKQQLKKLKGNAAIGHTRYSTSGRKIKHNVQPLTADLSVGPIAVAHNGNIVNFPTLKKQLTEQGSIFYGTSDTECLIHLLSMDLKNNKNQAATSDIINALQNCLPKLIGAYSFVLLTNHALIAARDPMGFRPLVLGKYPSSNGPSWALASETCAFDLTGAEFVREIKPGEVWVADLKGERSILLPNLPNQQHYCVFEHVYFARPDSQVFGRHVYQSRKAMGRILAKESQVPADIVLSVPDSGTASALGYSEASGIPYEMGIIRNHYVGRTFIHPSQHIRNFNIKIKLSPQKRLLKGKRIIVVDDSIVRGTTSRAIVSLLRKAGAKEIHFRVSSPPVVGPCFYGVDTPEKKELIAAQKTVPEIQTYLQADSLAFLSHQGLMQAVQQASNSPSPKQTNTFCSACFTGTYPTPI